jgi:hypothetical protein
MCIRLNNLLQLKEIRKHFYQKYNNVIQKQYNFLQRNRFKYYTLALVQQFKIELYKIKSASKNVEFKLSKIINGLLSLMVYRVCWLLLMFTIKMVENFLLKVFFF